jgi:hypothetical protein
MPQPPGLPQVFGPEPIPEPQSQLPVPAPTPIRLTVPAPPKDNRGIQDKNPIPRAPVRAPPPAPPPFAPWGSVRPPTPIRTVPLPGSGGASGQAGLIGRQAAYVQAPQPWVLKQEGATDTIVIGCILPFEGDLRLAGNAVYHALQLAVSEEAPTLLPGVNVNLTCVNTKCADIPAHMAMEKLVKEGEGEVPSLTACGCQVSQTAKRQMSRPGREVHLLLPTDTPCCHTAVFLLSSALHCCHSRCRWGDLLSRHSRSSRCRHKPAGPSHQPSSDQPCPLGLKGHVFQNCPL